MGGGGDAADGASQGEERGQVNARLYSTLGLFQVNARLYSTLGIFLVNARLYSTLGLFQVNARLYFTLGLFQVNARLYTGFIPSNGASSILGLFQLMTRLRLSNYTGFIPHIYFPREVCRAQSHSL